MKRALDLVNGRGLPEGMPDFEFLGFFTLLWTMMMVEGEGDNEGSEARSRAREVQCEGG